MNDQQTIRFSNREDIEQLREYRRVNLPATLSLFLGICSIGALLHTYLWIVAFAAVFAGCLGLWLYHRSDGMGGAVSAWSGIALALFFLSWAVAQFFCQRQVIYSEAEVVARNWLRLVAAGEDEIAHQAMLHPAIRQASGFSVDEYYSMDEQAMRAKNDIFGKPPASKITELGADAEIELIKNVTQDVDLKYGKLILQTYQLTAPGKEPVVAMLTIARTYKPDLGRASWIVANIGDPE